MVLALNGIGKHMLMAEHGLKTQLTMTLAGKTFSTRTVTFKAPPAKKRKHSQRRSA